MKANRLVNDINGLIILDKPKGLTSNACLSIIKKCLHPKKLGHTGTLDENATGVLVCLFGSATKSQDYLMKSGDKIYNGELILGISTDTEDITGKVINCDNDIEEKFDIEKIKNAVKEFIGEYNQIPPMYSAKKVGGKKLLNLARKGIEIERKVCKVKIIDIQVLDFEDYNFENYKLKKVNIAVTCSKGTYIRTLCKDIGAKLGIPSCMGNLRRIATGKFHIDDSISLEEIKKKTEENDLSFISPCFYQEFESAITFGKFETLHIGHQMIINDVVKYARDKNIKSTVMIVGGNEDSVVLSRDQRISKLKYLGVDNIINFELNDNNMKIGAEKFVKEILIDQLKARHIVVGSDCRFGYKGCGDTNLLKKIADEYNVSVEVVEKIKFENTDQYISSTLIKSEFEKGNIELVNKMLGKNI